MGVDLPRACAEYEAKFAGGSSRPGIVSGYRGIELRAFRLPSGNPLLGKPARDLLPGLRVFIERLRRGSEIIEAGPDTVLQAGDIVAISGPRQLLVEQIEKIAPEMEDKGIPPVALSIAHKFASLLSKKGESKESLESSRTYRAIKIP